MLAGMDHHEIILRIEAEAKNLGMKPEYLLRLATGNPYLWNRLPKKIAELDRIIAKVEAVVKERT